MKRLITFMLALWLSIGIAFAGNQTTSSTLASTIIDQARACLNDPTTHGGTQLSIWSDAQLLVYLNQGTMDIVTKSHCLEDVEIETLVESQTHYPLSDPFIVIKYVIYNDVKTLEEGNLSGTGEGFGHALGQDVDAEGEPAYWTIWENEIIVYPAPDATAAGNDIDVYVVDRPADVASSAAVLVPAQYDKALVYYITAQGWAQDGQMNRAGAFMTLYQQELTVGRSEDTQPDVQ